jgi:hypothetical protein
MVIFLSVCDSSQPLMVIFLGVKSIYWIFVDEFSFTCAGVNNIVKISLDKKKLLSQISVIYWSGKNTNLIDM